MEQQIRFCTTSDGVSIAYAVVGNGPPLVYVCGWPGNLALEWEQAFVREFLEVFAGSFTLVRYDMRGSGLSGGVDAEFTIDGLVRDLEAVVQDAGAERVLLLSLGLLAGPVLATYAAQHPERVDKLVFLGPYMRGGDLGTEQQQHAMLSYLTAFGQIAAPDFMDPASHGLDPDLVRQAGAIHEQAAPLSVIVSLMQTIFAVDLAGVGDKIDRPALVLHGNRDARVPRRASQEFAAHIKDVKFVPYQGAGSAPWADRDIILPEIFRFFGAAPPAPAPVVRGEHHAAIHTIFFTDIESSTSLTQQLGDAKAQELVQRHNSIVRNALRAHGGTEIKHTGDGIMASFHSASGALECAITIQRALAESGESESDPVRVRIGLNAGEPVEEDSDLFGTSVQLARRICDQAAASEIMASDVVRQLAAGKGFLFADRGEVVLRGFEDPVRVYEVRWKDS